MKIAVDIRPALRQGTGVGTFIENLVIALSKSQTDSHFYLFSSSLKDRLPDKPWRELENCKAVDARMPVRLMNTMWHRWGWPPVDYFTGKVDVSLSPSPLMLPARKKRIITIHDLYFLEHPEDTVGEIRRDYVSLVKKHAEKADAILSVSEATKKVAMEMLNLQAEKITVCREDISPMFDEKPTDEETELLKRQYAKPYFLFVGTIEPRKNLTDLLKAFAMVHTRLPEMELIIAGYRGWKTEAFDRTIAESFV
jgi:glycosyltransferase involved in cell wall biosynthesis